MTMYFLDSSAIVKRYFQEPGHEWIETLHDPAQDHELYIAQPEAEMPDFIFVSADIGLLSIADAEGFSIENPNNY